MLSYYKPIFDGKNILSCDSLRICLEFLDLRSLELFMDWLNKESFKQTFDFTYYPSYKDFSYRHLFVFGVKGLSFSLGLSLNGCSADDNLKGFLDINPNKILGSVFFEDGFFYTASSPFVDGEQYFIRESLCQAFEAIFRELCMSCLHITVKRFDVACDVPIVRNKVQLFKDNRAYSQFYRSQMDFTEYLGAVNTGGRVKVYNKTIESDLDYDLTRVEITCDSYDYELFYKRFPRVFIRESINLGQENVMVQLLQELPADRMDYYFRQLSKPTKLKYKALLMERPLVISEAVFDRVVSVCKEFEY